MYSQEVCSVHGTTSFKLGFCMECTGQSHDETLEDIALRQIGYRQERQLASQRIAAPDVAFEALNPEE